MAEAKIWDVWAGLGIRWGVLWPISGRLGAVLAASGGHLGLIWGGSWSNGALLGAARMPS